MYFMLDEQPLGDPEPLAFIESSPRVRGIRTWISGHRFDVEVPEPLEVILDERYPGRMPDYFKGSVPLMTVQLLAALAEAGVDNIQTYRAVIRDRSGKVLSEDYRAINVVGVVAAADLNASKVAMQQADGLFDTSFDSLTIDEQKAKGKLLFRLAESAVGIVVHESVRSKLIERGFSSLGFIEPSEWVS